MTYNELRSLVELRAFSQKMVHELDYTSSVRNHIITTWVNSAYFMKQCRIHDVMIFKSESLYGYLNIGVNGNWVCGTSSLGEMECVTEEEFRAIEAGESLPPNRTLRICEYCGSLIRNAIELHEDSINGFVCDDCVHALGLVKCDDCGELHQCSSIVRVGDDGSERHIHLCGPCKKRYKSERRLIVCEFHRRVEVLDAHSSAVFLVGYGVVCPATPIVVGEHRCDICGEEHEAAFDVRFMSGKRVRLCRHCLEKYHWLIEPASFTKHSFDFKPEPLFMNSDGSYSREQMNGETYFGVELELDDPSREERLGDVVSVLSSSHEGLYVKHDGSLQDGIEIVTNPMTYEYAKNMFPWSFVLDCADYAGLRPSRRCGLHIHVSRNAFNGDDDVLKAVYIFNELYYDIADWSDRSSLAIDRYARESPIDFGYVRERLGCYDWQTLLLGCMTAQRDDRYVAVNVRNRSTVEFRLFGSTMDEHRILAYMRFVQNVIDLSNLLSFRELLTMSKGDLLMNLQWNELVG